MFSCIISSLQESSNAHCANSALKMDDMHFQDLSIHQHRLESSQNLPWVLRNYRLLRFNHRKAFATFSHRDVNDESRKSQPRRDYLSSVTTAGCGGRDERRPGALYNFACFKTLEMKCSRNGLLPYWH